MSVTTAGATTGGGTAGGGASVSGDIDSSLGEGRGFAPAQAAGLGVPRWHVASVDEYRSLPRRSVEDPESFWREQGARLAWFRPFDRVLDWNPPDARWFVGGATNACYNSVDRHVQAGFGEQTAIVWEGEPVTPRTSHPAPGSR